jgi:hypothetical protein
MEHYEDRRAEIGGQSGDDLTERLDATSRSADYHEIAACHTAHLPGT